MSQSSVVAAVVERAGRLPGLVDAQAGRPETVQWPATPGALVYADAPTDLQQLTYGPDGIIQIRYLVHLDVLLGDQNLPEGEAYSLAGTLADSLRAAFWGDRSLGGLVFDSRLSQADDTLHTYRANLGSAQDRYGDYPLVRWQLTVIEHVAASHVAATD